MRITRVGSELELWYMSYDVEACVCVCVGGGGEPVYTNWLGISLAGA